MGESRTHISITTKSYKAAKKIKDDYRDKGIIITMEQALVLAKNEQKAKDSAIFGGFKI